MIIVGDNMILVKSGGFALFLSVGVVDVGIHAILVNRKAIRAAPLKLNR